MNCRETPSNNPYRERLVDRELVVQRGRTAAGRLAPEEGPSSRRQRYGESRRVRALLWEQKRHGHRRYDDDAVEESACRRAPSGAPATVHLLTC